MNNYKGKSPTFLQHNRERVRQSRENSEERRVKSLNNKSIVLNPFETISQTITTLPSPRSRLPTSTLPVRSRGRTVSLNTNTTPKHYKTLQPLFTTKKRKLKTLTLNDTLIQFRKKNTICKSNFRPTLQYSQIQNVLPSVQPLSHEQQESKQLRASWMSLTPRSSNFHFQVQGDHKGELINKRYKALNDKLLKNQIVYQEKHFNLDDHMVWKY